MIRKFVRLVGFLLLLIISFLGGILYTIFQEGKTHSIKPANAIVVLGAASYAGNPSPVFRARLDHAKTLYEKKLAPIIITTGGTFPGETMSEGLAGKKYLVEKGIPETAVIAEEEGMTTKQSIMRVADIAEQKGISSIILVSDQFHLLRSKLIAEYRGLETSTSAAPSSPISKNKKLLAWYYARELFLAVAHILFDI